MTRRFVPILGLFLALLLLVSPANAEGENNWTKQFQTQIHSWIDTIALRDPQFKQWQNAKTDVQTLGSNQHQWLVSITQSGKQVGYLVVGESPLGAAKFVLLEYGVGEYILFDDAFAPREIAAEPVYDGFASHWLLTQSQSSHMVNAKTGESYPSEFTASEPVIGTLSPDELVHNGEKLTQTRVLKQNEANPFDQISWVHDLYEKTDVTWSQLWQQNDSGSVTLTVPMHHSQVLAPFVVGSLHLWNDQYAYVGVWDEGLRFVPYSYAHKVGQFHVSKLGYAKASALP
ncbi:hypothetical protein [Brevibacillus choshinensis]|uniref:Uncharacterized protein n=1 Tax=Brevibacillus choshinensis TaxID=54911 RepID=A0ABX7FVL4_BRECH|nr:hypothetical protein [Brevibacillus choshinensis]QRG69758.1 hypothetical protein JNE38_11910 [Brevibacillus choshinensis]